jgi:mono/diheme cytochrome c family protein
MARSDRGAGTNAEVFGAIVMLLALGFAVAAGALGFFVGRATKHAQTKTVTSAATTTTPQGTTEIDPHVAAGAHAFVAFACAQCHGEQGKGGVSPDVPALTGAKSLTAAELGTIIHHGLGEKANPTKPYMPVWNGIISNTQVNDLVSYIHAGLPKVATASPPVVPAGQGAAVEGATLYTLYGCVNCHGPNGLGGVPNPQSEDKTIPPLSGQDFRNEFNTDAKIIDVIRSGSVIGKAPIVSMPHWGGIIPQDRLKALVAYLKTLQ